MGIQIIDDHDGRVLSPDTDPISIRVNDRLFRTEVYLSVENQAKLERLLADFLGPKQVMVDPARELDGLPDARDEDEDDCTAASLMAEFRESLAEPRQATLSTRRVTHPSRRSVPGSSTPKTIYFTREENEAFDMAAKRRLVLLERGCDFTVVSERQINDRMSQCINNSAGVFTGLRGFEAVSRQAEPREIGPNGKPLVNIMARRVS